MSKIKVTSQGYDNMISIWQQIRVAIGGKQDIDRYILSGCACIPSPMYRVYGPVKDKYTGDIVSSGNQQQVTQRQASYWSRARYMNATRRTAESLDGMIWSKQPEVQIPEQLEYLNVREYAQKTTFETIAYGRCGILVDMPDNDGTVTLAERANGLGNPSFIFYHPEQIIYTRHANGVLLEVRLLESTEVKKDELNYEQKEQVRRLYLDDDGYYTVEIWMDDKVISSVHPVINSAKMSYISFKLFGSDDNSADMSDAPMYDLASENLGHYRLSADNLDNLHYHGQGMTNVYTRMDTASFNEKNPNGLDVGANGRNLLEVEDRVEILQIEATGAIPTEMERVESRMIQLGAQLVQSSTGNQTLGAKRIESNASTSTLKRIAMNVSDGLEKCLTWAAEMVGASTDDVVYRLNTKFYTDDLTYQDIQIAFQMVQGGKLPDSVLYEVTRKAGYTDKDDEELMEEIFDGNIEGVSEREAELLAQIDSLQSQLNGGE